MPFLPSFEDVCSGYFMTFPRRGVSGQVICYLDCIPVEAEEFLLFHDGVVFVEDLGSV